MATLAHLDLILAFKGFHDHQDSFQLSLKPAILTIESIHATRHVTLKSDQLGLLLRTSQLQMSHVSHIHYIDHISHNGHWPVSEDVQQTEGN